jgi:hypothetical protein
MPNESLEKIVKSESGNLPAQDHGIVINNVVLAGLTVRHKLLPHRYLLEGFVVEDIAFNIKDFTIMVDEIKYQNSTYSTRNRKIYPKLIVDSKINSCSKFCKTISQLKHRLKSQNSPYDISNRDGDENWKSDLNDSSNFEYYLYETTTSNFPECAANKVFALCKYYEDGNFKYSIFNLHEIVPE